jgi:hypothetical protein
MKKNQMIAKTMMVSMLLLGGAVSANAQFGGLKGLANKAKKAAKDKVEEKVEDTKKEAVGQASDAAGIPTDNGIDASKVVWRWTGKESEMGEWSDKIVFNGDRKSEAYKVQVGAHMKIFNEILPKCGSTTAYGLVDYATFGPDKKTAVPIDEIPRYAWTKAFVDNPTLDNFKVFAMVLLYNSPTYMVYLEYIMNDKSTGVVNTQKGWMLPWPSESAMRSERDAREDYAFELAKKKIALKDICEYTCMQYQRAEAAVEQGSASLAHGYFLAEELKKHMIEEHPDYNASADCVRQVNLMAAKWEANNREMYRNMIDICGVNNIQPVDMPKGVSVPADVKSKGDAAAKSWAQAANLEYVKTIYLESQWRTFKNPKYPYNVTHHALKTVVIGKKGGKYVMMNTDLQKSLKGEYRMSVGLGAKLTPVNYK